jgi:hypothetical protein
MNYSESTDALLTLFWDGFKPEAVALLGYTPKVYWPDQQETGTPDTTKVWLRVSRRDLPSKLSGYGEGNNQSTKRYDCAGFLYIQMFYPQSDGSASSKFPLLASAAKDSLQGKHDPTNYLWIRDCTIAPLDPEASWFRKNVVVDFTYQEIKR